MSERETRIANNELLFRRANERIKRTALRAGVDVEDARVSFLCECADVACGTHVELTLAEYTAARGSDTEFVLAPGHERPDVEQIVDISDRYLVVDKVGDAGEAVEGQA